ncbi:hypothetical protein [Pseudoxanthomonas dokdonensis]|uniref:KEOPS complex Pcc1-like subunit n=1 Tax=Pseudoxanthomonas dokdonensis TaxID=344882 RepID=A0A0R0CZB3_9GAMM|nr:hypothetical protein [Pseudoxanthomonas dokdonensis]KRG71518.1 hypothetical protein ABB29_01710 [Pseudoxanthomonas dokdonensis]
MSLIRMRLTGSSDDANALITALHGLDDVDRAEEIADLMPHLDDADSSSAGLPDDIGPGTHLLEVDTTSDDADRRVREIARRTTENLGCALEFVDDDL